MFLDTSAVVAILLAEDGWEQLFNQLQSKTLRLTGAHVRLETSLVLSSRLNIPMSEAESFYDAFLQQNSIRALDVTDKTAHIAVNTYHRFGKGTGHRARLNFADCLSYACAQEHNVALLFVGDDFTHTDVRRV